MPIRAKEAGTILGVTATTIRNWCDQGLLPHSYSAAGQRIFNREDLEAFRRQRLGLPTQEEVHHWYYLRSSNGSDVLLTTQEDLLTQAYGTPTKVYRDKASGLNENRPGLKRLLDDLEREEHPVVVHVTAKDRLSRFGVKYLERLLQAYGGKLEVLDSEEAKEPHEVLMQDFMSLITSFSGKFYRLRGYQQRRHLLQDALAQVEDKEAKEKADG